MKYIYLFPDSGAMGNYQLECRKFGCEFLGKNRFQGERNLVIRGELSDLKRYAKWLDYELHPGYLYKENDFGGDIEDACKDAIVICPDMSLQEMKDYCEVYDVNVYAAGEKGKYRIEGREAKRVIEELKADGFIQDYLKDACKDSIYINGTLKDFNPRELVEKVKQRQENLHTNRIDKSGKVHTIFIDAHGLVENPSLLYVDVITQDIKGDNQERVLMKRCKDWEEAIQVMENYKRQHMNDSIQDEKKKWYNIYNKNKEFMNEFFGTEDEIKELMEEFYPDCYYEIAKPIKRDACKDTKIYYVLNVNNRLLANDDTLLPEWSEFVQCFPTPEKAEQYAKNLGLVNYKVSKYDYYNRKIIDETPYQKQYNGLQKELKKMDSIHKAIKAYNKFKKDSKVKDYDPRLLEQLKQIAQEGEKIKADVDKAYKAYYNVGNYYSWQKLQNEDPKKAELIIRVKEQQEKRVAELANKWDRIIEILNRGKESYNGKFNTLGGSHPKLPTSEDYEEVLARIKSLEKTHGKTPYSFDSKVKDSQYFYVADPDNEKELIQKAKNLGCKIEQIGGLLQVIGSSEVLSKLLKISEKEFLSYVDKPMSSIRTYK